MPQSKLTLSADKEIIEQARKIAREKNSSISAMFSQYIQAIADLEEYAQDLGPLTKKASGIINLPEDKTDKELLDEALWEKHGKKE